MERFSCLYPTTAVRVVFHFFLCVWCVYVSVCLQCVCTHECASMCACVYRCLCMWKPQVDMSSSISVHLILLRERLSQTQSSLWPVSLANVFWESCLSFFPFPCVSHTHSLQLDGFYILFILSHGDSLTM